MNPFGYLLVLAGAFLLRQTVVGRAKDIPSDARDAATALLSGNMTEFGSVLSRRGSNVSEPEFSSGDSGSETSNLAGASVVGGTYAGTVVKLGEAAKGYTLGGTGPSFYDCSGLLWKAAYTLGLYKGNRFTTNSFPSIASKWCTAVKGSPAIGDIVLWQGHHMGVVTGEDQMYSARSPSKGIGYSTISGDASFFGSQPTYFRPVGSGVPG